VNGRYALPQNESNARLGGLAPNGKTLVLTEVLSDQQKQKFNTDKRWVSHLAVLDTGLQTPARVLELDGNFSFDALSPNGDFLYLIEHLTPYEDSHYQVRQYNLASNQLNPQVVVDKAEGETVMQGFGGSQVITPKGDWVFTFYQKTEHPFIHALSTENGFAVCLDLPPAGKLNDPTSKYWGLALNSKGTTLYAVNSLLGQVAEINVNDFPQIGRTVTLPITAQGEVKQRPVGSAGVSSDGTTLYALDNTGLVAIDTQTLNVRNRLATDRSFDSLATNPTGTGLYAASSKQGKIFVLDTTSGKTLAELTTATQPWGLLGVEVQP
jgi:YVTN family beta-propeller protein